MIRRPGRILLLTGAVLLAALIAGRVAAGFYTEALWYQALGRSSIFWIRLGTRLGVRLAAGALAGGLVLLNLWLVARRLGPVHLRRQYGNIEIAEQVPRIYIHLGLVAVAVLTGWWLSGLQFGGDAALSILAWLRRVPWGSTDPLFGRDLSFYVFSLPVYFRTIDYLLLIAMWTLALVLIGYIVVGTIRWRGGRLEVEDEPRLHFVLLAAAIVLLLGARYWLGRYGLLLDGSGIGGGPGYTDVTARLPARRFLALLSAASAAALVYAARRRSWVPAAIGLGGLGAAALVVGQLYPSLVQKFRVEPNQLAREVPYIRWNLDFTRRAYGLDRLDRRTIPYHRSGLPSWETLEPSLSRLPLWDPAPLETVYNQVEAIFGYYGFPDVDSDRYPTAAGTRQVAISVREFDLEGLPESARTWQTLRLNPKYLRGFGVVVSPVAESIAAGGPRRWIRNVDPVLHDPEAPAVLNLEDPAIYFGETMGVPGGGQEYVILIPGRDSAFTGVPGEDYPAGIRLASFVRLLAFAWRFGDKNLLFSGELTDDSRVVYRRSVRERVAALAPFALWDRDPYPVIARGRVFWIIDGYTTSSTFPLARPLRLGDAGRIRYLRNSLKAVVDAVTGEVMIYEAAGETDPILATYGRIFPDLVRPLDEMPAALRAHLRYPVLYLRAQAEILKEYHLESPEAFYAGQDYWQLPQEDANGTSRYRPPYAMMRLPGEKRTEFVLTAPFIARERENMTAFLVARSDPPHYGELLLYELPRDQQIPGPGQVAALIEQDPSISPQLSLWRRSGSEVQLGDIRVVPLDSAFLYVQPVFLSAREGSIPELARIVVSDGRAIAMALSLVEAVRAVESPPPVDAPGPTTVAGDASAAVEAWPLRALELLDRAERRLRSGDWAGFGSELEELRTLLRELSQRPRDEGGG
ncbi:MAG TPA: UPF0182 family protein [Longimicrobiales bacterium]